MSARPLFAWSDTRGAGPPSLFSAVLSYRYKVQVVGDFALDEARRFFESRLKLRSGAPPLDDASWLRIFEVCGGNALRLQRVADLFEGPADLEAGALRSPRFVHASRHRPEC